MVVFQVFHMVQMVLNRAKRLILIRVVIYTLGVSHALIQLFSFFYSRSKNGIFENLMFYAELRYNFRFFALCITDSMVKKFQRRI